MRDFAKRFYKSKAWKDCRQSYLSKVGGLCERCLKRGLYTPAEIIHHKIILTPDNIDDPRVTLNFDNLEAVCRDCHAAEHEEIYFASRKRRWRVNKRGQLVIRADA